jgi:hypothetical protein
MEKLTFAEKWHAEKALKRAKKKAKKQLMEQGDSPSEASKKINTALKRIVKTNGVQRENVSDMPYRSQ